MKINSPTYATAYMNSEMAQRDKTLSKIASALELKMEDSSSRSIASMLQSQLSGASQGLMNVNDGISMMQIVDGALQSLSSQTQTLNDLSVRYNSASLNESQKQMLQTQFNDTLKSMEQTVETTSYNGKQLFGSVMNFSTGEGNIDTTVGAVDPQGLSIDNQQSIDTYRQRLDSVMSDIGSATNAFVISGNALMEKIASTASAKSQIADTDMSKAIENFQKQDLKLNAAQLALAHQNNIMQQNIARLLG